LLLADEERAWAGRRTAGLSLGRPTGRQGRDGALTGERELELRRTLQASQRTIQGKRARNRRYGYAGGAAKQLIGLGRAYR